MDHVVKLPDRVGPLVGLAMLAQAPMGMQMVSIDGGEIV